MGALSPWHWAIVAVVVVILFGSKKLPEAARGLGRSLRIFKSEVKEMQNDGKAEAPAAQAAAPTHLNPAVPVDPHAVDAHPVEGVSSRPDTKSA